jgi:hypothetical protein
MATEGYRTESGKGTGETIKDLPGGALSIPSFTDPEKAYKVHVDSQYCSCPAAHFGRRGCKHLVLAEAIEKARSVRFGRRIAERNLVELCQRIYAPHKGDTPRRSYDLLIEVLAYRHSTDAMKQAALKRHGRVLYLDERRAA